MTAAQIKALRVALEMTQEEFGAAIGVHAVTVGRWETERKKPSPMAMRGIQALAHRTLSKTAPTLTSLAASSALLRQQEFESVSTALDYDNDCAPD